MARRGIPWPYHDVPVYTFRPTSQREYPALNLWRYANGLWVPDDGKYDLAFVTAPEHAGRAPFAYWYQHDKEIRGDEWYFRELHPNAVAGEAAMRFCSHHHGCANGRVHKDYKWATQMMSESAIVTPEYVAESVAAWKAAFDQWLATEGRKGLEKLVGA